jgi:hypothetical protein
MSVSDAAGGPHIGRQQASDEKAEALTPAARLRGDGHRSRLADLRQLQPGPRLAQPVKARKKRGDQDEAGAQRVRAGGGLDGHAGRTSVRPLVQQDRGTACCLVRRHLCRRPHLPDDLIDAVATPAEITRARLTAQVEAQAALEALTPPSFATRFRRIFLALLAVVFGLVALLVVIGLTAG